MKRIFILIAIALLCASCENEKEPPSGTGPMPQITLTNNSPSTAYFNIFNTNGVRIAGTDMVEPYTSAQAKFMKTNIDPAGEYVRIQVWKREDSASDKKLYEEGFTLRPRDRYTYIVDKDYNVCVPNR